SRGTHGPPGAARGPPDGPPPARSPGSRGGRERASDGFGRRPRGAHGRAPAGPRAAPGGGAGRRSGARGAVLRRARSSTPDTSVAPPRTSGEPARIPLSKVPWLETGWDN